MFYIAAFVLGGFARSLPKLLLFAAVYMLLYSALMVAIEFQTLKSGTKAADIFGHLALDWVVGFVICGMGYLCRVLFVGQRPPPDAERQEEVGKTFD